MDYNFLNPGYAYAFQDDQVLLEQNDKEFKKVCSHCLLVPRYRLYFKCGNLSCPSCFREYRRYKFMFEKFVLVQFSSILVVLIKSLHIKYKKINVITLFQWECSNRQSLFTCTQNVKSRNHWKNIHRRECSNNFIGVFYVLLRVVNSSLIWKL